MDLVLNDLQGLICYKTQTTYQPGPLWPGEVAPDRVLSMGQIELNYVLMLNWIV